MAYIVIALACFSQGRVLYGDGLLSDSQGCDADMRVDIRVWHLCTCVSRAVCRAFCDTNVCRQVGVGHVCKDIFVLPPI